MIRPFDLWITNCFTNEVEVIKDFYLLQGDCENVFLSAFLFIHLKKYLDNQIPFKVEFNYKPLGKSN